MRVLIFGTGHLGLKVAKLYREQNPDVPLTGLTRTTARHEEIRKIGVRPGLTEETEGRYSRIFFAVPTSQQASYLSALKQALEIWDRQGPFVFSSSTSVYPQKDGGWVDERTPIDGASLLGQCEKLVSDHGGIVARFAGLYDWERGPHRYYFRHQTLPTYAGEWINLINTDDAAKAASLLLGGELHSALYNICDGEPITREVLSQSAYETYTRMGVKGIAKCQFTGGPVLGKRVKSVGAVHGFKAEFPSFLGWLEKL